MMEKCISYSANGLTAKFDKKTTVYVGMNLDDGFNRYMFNYTSTNPLKVSIIYIYNGSKYEETLFLEATETEKTFRSFIDSFLTEGKAHGIEEFTFTNLGEDECTVNISGLTTELVPVLSKSMAYIENDYFCVGAFLAWGGGLSHISYKKDCPYGMCNLLNRYDAGRLVQQSYYGIIHEPYRVESYMNNKWPYNPVQGGDQYNNKSKLIDYELSDTKLYIKCRPRDWAKRGAFTDSYMENVYSLEDKYIKVDNRFVDFSGYKHDSNRQQKLPAFYTISALKKFSFYDGINPWQNEPLREERELNYWMYYDGYFNLKSENTETWCAWTNDDPEYDFGLGLFVPQITTYLAGRFMYDGSADSADPSTSFVAPLRSMIMKSFKPIEYSYLITAGSIDEIRNTFTENSTLIDNKSLAEY